VIHFDISKLEQKLYVLESQTTVADFWSNSQKSSSVLKNINTIKEKIQSFKKVSTEFQNIWDINELLKTEEDADLEKELIAGLKSIEKDIDKLEISTLLSGKYDSNNAIITLHPGAGGTEAQDWAQMLYRMYIRWANDNEYKIQELDYLDGEEAGIKSVTFLVSGEFAYGYLKGEQGVHRLVRISPFDAGGRRHTSFASVEVLPEIGDEISIDINQDDLRIDTYRASRSRRTTY